MAIRDNPKPVETLPSSAGKRILNFLVRLLNLKNQSWRLTILNTVLFATFVLALLSATAGSINQIEDGRYQYVVFYVFAVLVLSAAAFLKKMNYHLRVAILLITFYFVAVSEMLASGLTGDGDHFLTTVVILSGILLNRNKGLIIFAMTIFTFVLIAYLTVSGYIRLEPFLGEVSYRARNWTSAIVAYVFMTALMFISTAFMRIKLEDTINQNEFSIGELTRENKIREEREQSLKIFEELLTTTYDAIAYIDRHDKVRTCNDAFLKEFISDIANQTEQGRSAFTVEDLKINDITPKINKAQQGEKTLFEKKISNQLGEDKYLEIQLTPFVDENKQPDGIVFVARDITYQVNMERDLIEMNEEEYRTFSIVLHDGLSHFLLNVAIQCNMLYRKLKKSKSKLTAEVENLERQINEAIALTRNISSGLFPNTLNSLNLNEILEQKKKLLEGSFGINCTIDVDPNLVITDKTAAMHLHYIIQEAVINIIKHSGATIVEMRLNQENSIYDLMISDNGRRKINKKQDQYSGTGLKIMEYRAKIINGEISINLASQETTEVNCRFPSALLSKNDVTSQPA